MCEMDKYERELGFIKPELPKKVHLLTDLDCHPTQMNNTMLIVINTIVVHCFS